MQRRQIKSVIKFTQQFTRYSMQAMQIYLALNKQKLIGYNGGKDPHRYAV